MKVYTYIIYFFFIASCKKNSWKIIDHATRGNFISKTYALDIIDSICIKGNVSGFAEYIAASISPDKERLIVMPYRGGKKFSIYNLKLKKLLDSFSLDTLSEVRYMKEGIYNIGFLSNSIISITFRNKLFCLIY